MVGNGKYPFFRNARYSNLQKPEIGKKGEVGENRQALALGAPSM